MPLALGVPVPSGISLPSHGFGAGLNGLDDVVIARAAADVAIEPVPDFVVAEARLALHQRYRRHHHPGGTEAALQSVIVAESLLHRVQGAVLRQALDCGDLCPFSL